MEDSLTQVQKEFVHLLKGLGCSQLQTLIMGLELWHPDDLAEMLEFMADNPDSTPTQLYEMCSKISSRRPDPEELNF